jgi:hypothetical protein
METTTNSTFIPINTTGKPVNIQYAVTERTIEEALDTFNRACKRLLNPSVWKVLAGAASATFKLVGRDGEELHRLLSENDYIAIDIPGLGSIDGDGFDWVKVESIEENIDAQSLQSFGIRLRLCISPKENNGTAHFFSDDATSTFIIKRSANTITASYHGRNERSNFKSFCLADKIRNALVTTGAIAGLSELQRSTLIGGLLHKEIGGSE